VPYRNLEVLVVSDPPGCCECCPQRVHPCIIVRVKEWHCRLKPMPAPDIAGLMRCRRWKLDASEPSGFKYRWYHAQWQSRIELSSGKLPNGLVSDNLDETGKSVNAFVLQTLKAKANHVLPSAVGTALFIRLNCCFKFPLLLGPQYCAKRSAKVLNLRKDTGRPTTCSRTWCSRKTSLRSMRLPGSSLSRAPRLAWMNGKCLRLHVSLHVGKIHSDARR
jgi:hypothetical protein